MAPWGGVLRLRDRAQKWTGSDRRRSRGVNPSHLLKLWHKAGQGPCPRPPPPLHSCTPAPRLHLRSLTGPAPPSTEASRKGRCAGRGRAGNVHSRCSAMLSSCTGVLRPPPQVSGGVKRSGLALPAAAAAPRRAPGATAGPGASPAACCAQPPRQQHAPGTAACLLGSNC